MSNFLRLVLALFGISAVGFIVMDMLKKWQIVHQTISPAWVIVPLNLLFLFKELINSTWLRNNCDISPKTLKYMGKTVETLQIIIFIIMIISIPFIWIGAIETVSGSVDAVKF